ncbi:MAG: hypothetical protein HGA22_07780, partial [Clostridiales bacterium]|nr:hypothetical protein [Clostridiales bacterium]
DSDVAANQWGVLSTDSGSNMVLTVVDSTLTLRGTHQNDPFSENYGSGYGTYIIGDAQEYFYGATFNVGTYASILTGGDAIYASSDFTGKGGSIDIKPLVMIDTGETTSTPWGGTEKVYRVEESATPVFTGITGDNKVTTINSDAFGFMAHNSGSLTITDGTVVNSDNASFLMKAGNVDINVSDGAQLNTEDGIILQMIDNDDSIVGADMGAGGPNFKTDFYEVEGYPGLDYTSTASTAGRNTVNFNAAGVALSGNLYNGTGYFAGGGGPGGGSSQQAADLLNISLGRDATLDGAISATSIIHVNENGVQNTHFTIDEYYYLGHVANKNYYNGGNDINVTLSDNAVWNINGDSIVTNLTIPAGTKVAATTGCSLTVKGTLTVGDNSGISAPMGIMMMLDGAPQMQIAPGTYSNAVITFVAMGGGGGGPPAGDSAHKSAAIYVSDGARVPANEYNSANPTDPVVDISTAAGAGGVTGSSADGVYLDSGDYGATGIVVTKGVYSIGGSSENFDVYSFPGDLADFNIGTTVVPYSATSPNNLTSGASKIGSGFNSVLLFDLDSVVDAAATKGSSGLDVDNDAIVDLYNVYMQVDGARRYTVSNYNSGTLIVNDSTLVSTGDAGDLTSSLEVPFSNEPLLISGTARTNFSIGATKTMYFNSIVAAEGWAALSTDSATGSGLDLYAYNTQAGAFNGGYGTYADTNCRVHLFGSLLLSSEIGAIISKSGSIETNSGANLAPDILAYNKGATTDAQTSVSGGRNAFMIHAPDMMHSGRSAADCGTLNISNSYIETDTEVYGMMGTIPYDYSKYGTAVKAYVDYVSGDDILVKSTSADISLSASVMSTYNGVLIHTVLNNDDQGNFLTAGDNLLVKPVAISMMDMSPVGDILHEDYQRDMTVSLTNTNLTGSIFQGTHATWNTLWSSKGVDSANWLPNSSWTGTNNLTVTLDAASTWTVDGESIISSLTAADADSLKPGTGFTSLYITVDGSPVTIEDGVEALSVAHRILERINSSLSSISV